MNGLEAFVILGFNDLMVFRFGIKRSVYSSSKVK